jgi:CRISPR-associated protein Csx1
MEGKRLLIEVWGNPSGWKRTKYKYKGLDEEPHKTTLPRLINDLKPDKVIVFVPDTIVNEESTSYEEIVERVGENIRGFIRDLGIEAGDRIEVLVQPNIGFYTLNNKEIRGIRAIGSTNNYMLTFALSLSRVLEEFMVQLQNSREKRVEVYLDITHGVNYMPVLARAALYHILSSIGIFLNTKLVVLNSDPVVYSPKSKESESSTYEDHAIKKIHEVEVQDPIIPEHLFFPHLYNLYEKRVKQRREPVLFKSLIGRERKLETIDLRGEFEERVDKLGEIEDRLISEVFQCGREVNIIDCVTNLLAFASSIQFILPLWILYLKPQLNELEDTMPLSKLEKITREKVLKETIIAKIYNNTLYIIHTAEPTMVLLDIVKALLAMEALSTLGYKDINPQNITLRDLTLDKIFSEKPIARYSPILRYFSNRLKFDVKRVKEQIKEWLENRRSNLDSTRDIEVPLAKIYNEKSNKQVNFKSEDFERNFISHSGLEYNIVKLVISRNILEEFKSRGKINSRQLSEVLVKPIEEYIDEIKEEVLIRKLLKLGR